MAPDQIGPLLRRLKEEVAEAFVLSTCGRVELYAVCGHEATGARTLRRHLAQHAGMGEAQLEAASYALGHRAAVVHALRVAAGLGSMVLGESEIQGQWRRALDLAREAETLGPVLERLGATALACGKRVRAEAGLRRTSDSVPSVALALAERAGGLGAPSRVVVLGAGETAQLAMARLAQRRVARVTILNRTPEHAQALAEVHGAAARPWSDLDAALSEADVVVACTGSMTPALDPARLAAAPRPLLCVDLGFPRALAPEIARLGGVTVIDLEDVRRETSVRREKQQRAAVRGAALVEEDAEPFMEWWRGRTVTDTIARLHAHAGAITEAEVARALSRLSGLDPRFEAVLRDLARRLMGKLLHEPTVAMKRDPEGANLALAAVRMFGIAGDGAPLVPSAVPGAESGAKAPAPRAAPTEETTCP